MSVETLVNALGGDPGYVKFLLVERLRIRSALLARPVPYDEESRIESFPSSLGNALHNDIIDLETWLDSLPVQDRTLLLAWAEDGGRQVYGRMQLGRGHRGKRIQALVSDFAEKQRGKQEGEPPARPSDGVPEGRVAEGEGIQSGDPGLS